MYVVAAPGALASPSPAGSPAATRGPGRQRPWGQEGPRAHALFGIGPLHLLHAPQEEGVLRQPKRTYASTSCATGSCKRQTNSLCTAQSAQDGGPDLTGIGWRQTRVCPFYLSLKAASINTGEISRVLFFIFIFSRREVIRGNTSFLCSLTSQNVVFSIGTGMAIQRSFTLSLDYPIHFNFGWN